MNPFQYTGREFDAETGIYEYRARYYDQGIGRFTSEDPAGFQAGVDFYAYGRNSPTNRVDPDGMGNSPKTCAEALVELGRAQAKASERWIRFVAHGDNDPGHAKALAEALNRLNRAIETCAEAL